ncbi:MAG: VWA domain-containing protein [Candidatus Binatia bacterium]
MLRPAPCRSASAPAAAATPGRWQRAGWRGPRAWDAATGGARRAAAEGRTAPGAARRAPGAAPRWRRSRSGTWNRTRWRRSRISSPSSAVALRSRFARRQRRAGGGRVDMRRTIRRALSRGGVPVEILFRTPRPGKSDLLALVDVSYSTATAAEFLLALLAPARRYFRRVALLAYVDRPCAVSFEGGHVVPHERLDLNARSDFGNVLRLLGERPEAAVGRNTVLLILGDARNNRRPPRADLLADLHRAARHVVWLNPEPPARWNTGDSVIATYARDCDAVLAAWNPRTLAAALGQLAGR